MAPINFIVPEVDLITHKNILKQSRSMSLHDFGFVNNELTLLQWLAARRLIRNSFNCVTCEKLMILVVKSEESDGYLWICSGCNGTKTVCDGSFFSKSHLGLKHLIILIYCWIWELPEKYVKHELQINFINWYNLCRELCKEINERNQHAIGGLDGNDIPKVVEIDKTSFLYSGTENLYPRPGCYIFGGIERKTNNCFMVPVFKRTEETFPEIIQQYVLPGSIIVSHECLDLNTDLSQIYGGIYEHDTVSDHRNSLRSYSAYRHKSIKNVQTFLSCVQKKLCSQFIESELVLIGYLQEFMWRNSFSKDENLFGHFLVDVSTIYNL